MDGMNISQALKHRMNYLIDRQGVVSGNIANASTPNYLSRDLDFDALVTKKMSSMTTTNSKHLSGTSTMNMSAMTEDKVHIRHDGNSVKIDEEMLKLQDIQLNYRLMTRLLGKHAGMQRMAISDNAR